MLSLLVMTLLLQYWRSDAQERAPLYIFEAEEDLNETYGIASGSYSIVYGAW